MKLVGLVAAIAAIGLLPPSPRHAPPMAGQAWGEPNGGLRIGIAAVNPDNASSADVQFEVALENTGAADFVLNLGHMLANGKVMFPSSVRLVLTDPSGQARELQYFDRKYPRARRRLHRSLASWLRLHNSGNDGPLLESVHKGVRCDTDPWAVSNSGAVPRRGCANDKCGHARRDTHELLERHRSIECS
jgi:hypothetical protein